MASNAQPQGIARISQQWASSVLVAATPAVIAYQDGSIDQLIFSSAHKNFIGLKGYETGVTAASYSGNADQFPDSTKVQSTDASEQTTLIVFRRFSGATATPAIYLEVVNGLYFRNAFYFNGSNWVWRTRDTSSGDAGAAEDLALTSPVSGNYETRAFVYSASSGSKAAYLNGKIDASSSSSVNPFTSTNADGIFLNGADSSNGNATYGSDSRIALFARFNRALSAAEVRTLSDNPWQIFAQNRRTIDYTNIGGGASNYTLSTTQSTFGISSKSASFSFNRNIDVASKSYLIASKAATFAFNRKLSLASSAYAISAKTATLTYTNGAVTQNYTLSATSSAYAISSKTAWLSFNRKLSVTSAVYAIASKTAALTYTAGNSTQNYILSAAVREYAITSGSATLNFSSITNYTNAPSGVTYHRDFVNSKRESSLNSTRPAFKNTTRH